MSLVNEIEWMESALLTARLCKSNPSPNSSPNSTPTPNPIAFEVAKPTTTVNSNLPLQQRAPQYELKNERAFHRIALEYIAKGYTDKEIAEMMGCTAPTVGHVRKHPRYQESLLTDIQRKLTEDQEVVEFIKKNVVGAVKTLSEVMNDGKARNSDRIAAAEALLNRRYGKPNQPVNAGNSIDLNNLPDAELAKMLPQGVTETSYAV